MGLYKYSPEPSSRMGLLWTLGTIAESVIIEFGSMGHMVYAWKWMEQTGVIRKSKLYSTHINETDIALGNTVKLEDAIVEIIEKDKPKAVFILPSSVPEMIGIDLEAVCENVQSYYENIPVIVFSSGGFKTNLNAGIEEGLYTLCKCLPVHKEPTEQPSFNIIGSCADFYRFCSDANEIVRILKGVFHMDPLCTLSSDTSISSIINMSSAHVNIVLRYEGLKAAKELERRFGTPYVFGRPYGYEGTLNWLNKVKMIGDFSRNKDFIENELIEGEKLLSYCRQMFSYHSSKSRLSVGGHEDIVNGILSYGCELNMKQGISWYNNYKTETEEALIAQNTAIPYWNNEEWSNNIDKEKGGILMTHATILKQLGRDTNMRIDRGLDRYEFNRYESPLVGFRGALNLGNLWCQEIMK